MGQAGDASASWPVGAKKSLSRRGRRSIVLPPEAPPGYCVGLMPPASMPGIVAVRGTWRGQALYAVPVWRGRGRLQFCYFYKYLRGSVMRPSIALAMTV